MELWRGEPMAEMAAVAALPIPTGVMEILGVKMAKQVPPPLAEPPEGGVVLEGQRVGLAFGVTVRGVTMEVTGMPVVAGVRAHQALQVLPVVLWEDGGSPVGRAEQALKGSMVEEAVAAVVEEGRITVSGGSASVTTLVQVGGVAELAGRVVSVVQAGGAVVVAMASSWSLMGLVVRSWIVG